MRRLPAPVGAQLKKAYFAKFGGQAQAILPALLNKYADEGVAAIVETKIFTIAPFTSSATPINIIRTFGGKAQY